MTKKRYDLCVPKPGSGDKTYWQKVGALWVDGDKISVKLDAIPAGMIQGKNGPTPWEGWINAFDSDKSNSGGGGGGGQRSSYGQKSNVNDDEIPY